MHQLRARLLTAIPTIALVLGTTTVGAQGGFVARATAGPSNENHRTIPLATAKAVIAAHHPDVADGSLDPAFITVLLDLNDNYITSVANKAAVVVRTAEGGVAAAGGFVSATPVGAGGGGGGAAVMTPRATSPSPPASMTIAGIGPIDSNLVQEVFTTSYAAGELGPNTVRVRYVILKSAPK